MMAVGLYHHHFVLGFIILIGHHSEALDSPIVSAEALIRPAIIVFDPDKIIWPFYFKDVLPPLWKKNENVIVDRAYRQLKVYRQVPALFEELHRLGHKLAVISQSADNATLCQLLDFFGLDKFISYREIYPENKTEHVLAVYLKADVDYGDMMYLAREYREIEPMADLGMVCIIVGDQGVTMKDIKKGFHIFSTESPEYSYSEDTHESSYLHKD